MAETANLVEPQEGKVNTDWSPRPPLPAGTETFADMPEAPMPFDRMNFGERAQMIEELQTNAEAPAESPDSTAPSATPSAAPPVPDIQNALYNALQAFDQNRRAEDEFQRRTAQEWALPDLDEEKLAEALTSPAKFKELLTERDHFHFSRAQTAVAEVARNSQAQAQLVGELLQESHANAWDAVRDMYKGTGIDPDRYYGTMELAFRKNPQSYWQIRRDPKTMAEAVRYIHASTSESGQFSGRPETPGRPVQISGTQPSGRGNPDSTRTDSMIQRAERALGITLSPENRAAYFAGRRTR